MYVTIEISIYPLVEDYTGIIIAFINSLKNKPGIEVNTTAMSTYITGDYDKVMSILTEELKLLYTKVPDSSTIVKIIPKNLNVEKGFLSF